MGRLGQRARPMRRPVVNSLAIASRLRARLPQPEPAFGAARRLCWLWLLEPSPAAILLAFSDVLKLV